MSGDDRDRERDLIAAEYVLGTIDEDAARTVERTARSDTALAGAIAAWEERLLPLTALVDPVDPAPELWPALAAFVEAPPREPLARPHSRPPGAVRRVWSSAGVWRMAAALLLLATGALAWDDVGRRILAPPSGGGSGAQLAIATMAAPGSTLPIAVAELADGEIVVRPSPGAAAATRDAPALGLWALPVGATAPRLLGLLPRGGGRLPSPELPAGSTVMVTAEPARGPDAATPGRTLFAGIVARVD